MRAVVVGVEEYDAGPTWALDGPAADACRMVDWLTAGGLAAEQVTLLVAPLARNQRLVASTGLPVRRPSRATIHELFTRELRDQDPAQLLVYWGGHGVIDLEGNRRLFCADATRVDKRSINFDDLRAFLATTYFRGSIRQVFIVDACQVLAAERRYTYDLPADGWPRGPHQHGREQQALFAASAGEVAENLTAQQTGRFTAELLPLLEKTKTTPERMDLAALAEALDRRFTHLRTSGEARQTPSYLYVKSPTREGLIYRTPQRAGSCRLALPELRELVEAMLMAPELVDSPRRQRLIMMMPNDIRAAVEYSGSPRVHLISLISACERFSTGRAALVGLLELAMDDAMALTRIVEVVDRLWPE